MARPRFQLLRRLWWSFVLVLVACGGAGLAVHSDKPQDPEIRRAPDASLEPGQTPAPGQSQNTGQRPELFNQADAELETLMPALDERLTALDERVAELSSAGTDLLGAFFSLDPESALAAADEGDAASAATGTAFDDTTAARDGADAAVERWRLSPSNRERLALIDVALQSSSGLTTAWSAASADARLAAAVLQPLAEHDALLTEATNAGRQSRWGAAVTALEAAAEPLAEASAAVGLLPASLDVARMQSLMAAYEGYDQALLALYDHIARTDSVSGQRADALLATVQERQAQVPKDRLALGEVVVGALGQALSEAVVDVEGARADIFDALPGEELETPDEQIEPDAFDTDDGATP